MENEVREIVQICSEWTPVIIVSLIKEIVWPIAIVVLGWRFRGSIAKLFSNFFSRNDVTEFSASPTGVTAKFKSAPQQSNEASEVAGSKVTSLSEYQSFDNVKQKQLDNTTEFSTHLKLQVVNHVAHFDVSKEERLELLSTEISLLQASIRFGEISKVIFRSQFDLMNEHLYKNECVLQSDIKSYFSAISRDKPEAFENWDYVAYMTYPISNGIIESSGENYKLTMLGRSYVEFMKNNIPMVNELAKL